MPLGGHFSFIFRFFLEKEGSWNPFVFWSNFESPRALQDQGSHAIHTRLCSRNALFDFITFSENSSQKSPLWGPFRWPFSLKSWFCVKKKDAKKQVEKSVRPHGNGTLSSFPRAPWQPPLACALFQQETTVRAKVSGIVAQTRFFLENVVWIRFHC